jgi:hypothetical protein
VSTVRTAGMRRRSRARWQARERVAASRALEKLSSDGVAEPSTTGMPRRCARRTATSRAE